MANLPTNRSTANTEAEHVDDHNEVHRLHNQLDDAAATNGDILQLVGGAWTSQTAAASSISETSHTHTSTLTTKGDVLAWDTAEARLAVGTNGQVLTVDSVQGTGIKWATAPGASPLTTKGDVFVFTTVDARLAIGANGEVLTAASGETAGMEWVSPATSRLANTFMLGGM